MSRPLEAIYSHRFTDREATVKDRLWREITRYLQRFVREDGAVLDIACDRGDFIRNIRAREKWASDLRDVSPYLGEGIRFMVGDGLTLDQSLPNGHFDVVFMSNYLEHLPERDLVIQQLVVARRLARPGGKVLVLQPNIRLIGHAYWDFIDHKVALTERSLVEAGTLAGLTTVRLISRFLPYTTKSRLPQHPALVRMYLRFPPAWRILGKQTMWVGETARTRTADGG